MSNSPLEEWNRRIHTQIDISSLKRWCMWCLNSRIWSDGYEDVYITCNAKDTRPCMEVGQYDGLYASAENNDNCEYFDWDFTRPGADWAKVVLDALGKGESA